MALMILGGIFLMNTAFNWDFQWLETWWPLAPVGFGAWLFAKGLADRRRASRSIVSAFRRSPHVARAGRGSGPCEGTNDGRNTSRTATDCVRHGRVRRWSRHARRHRLPDGDGGGAAGRCPAPAGSDRP
ncbi:MAG: hypothetical protein ACE5IK_03820 [Acidobacteriota bacterium]